MQGASKQKRQRFDSARASSGDRGGRVSWKLRWIPSIFESYHPVPARWLLPGVDEGHPRRGGRRAMRVEEAVARGALDRVAMSPATALSPPRRPLPLLPATAARSWRTGDEMS